MLIPLTKTCHFIPVPSRPQNVQAKLVDDTLIVQWDPPVEENGILTSYRVCDDDDNVMIMMMMMVMIMMMILMIMLKMI